MELAISVIIRIRVIQNFGGSIGEPTGDQTKFKKIFIKITVIKGWATRVIHNCPQPLTLILLTVWFGSRLSSALASIVNTVHFKPFELDVDGCEGLWAALMSQSLNLAGQVKVDGPGGLNWTVRMTETGRSWFMNKTGRSKRLKVDGLRMWTVLKSKSGQFKGKRL